ncbi:MAG: CopD family protein [Flavobacteriales bacterium]|jgi:copper resistance protein D|nr:CopD family protein [Flavobacteriales bacterium]
MNLTYLISVFIHIISAAFWIGGMLFLPLVLLPGIKNHPDRLLLLQETGIRFRFIGWITLLILSITGVLNMYLKGLPLTWDYLTHSNYGNLLSIKIILFIVMLVIGGIHDFYIGQKSIEEMKVTDNSSLKQMARWSGRINILLALIIAFIGVVLSRGGF